jgi:tRNA(His) 5'-end guanylyltransferase
MMSLHTEIDMLGDKFKCKEKEFVHVLNPNKYTIVRVDGNCFSTFTKSFQKPCDPVLTESMVYACGEWLKKFNGVCVYTQSDEATLIIDKIPAESRSALPFNGVAGKIMTLSSSLFSSMFNEHLAAQGVKKPPAIFDARVFQVDTDVDVMEVIRWRQLDCFRNGVSALARSLFSNKELLNKSVSQMLKMIDTDTLTEYKTSHLLHGTFVKKELVDKNVPESKETVTRTNIKTMVLGYRTRVVLITPELITCKYFDTSNKSVWHYVGYFNPGPNEEVPEESNNTGNVKVENIKDNEDTKDKEEDWIDDTDGNQCLKDHEELKKLILEEASALPDANAIASIDKSIADIKAMP